MSTIQKKQDPAKDRFSQLNEDELRVAEANLRRYLSVVRRIFEHIEKEKPKVLTELARRARLRKKNALR